MDADLEQSQHDQVYDDGEVQHQEDDSQQDQSHYDTQNRQEEEEEHDDQNDIEHQTPDSNNNNNHQGHALNINTNAQLAADSRQDYRSQDEEQSQDQQQNNSAIKGSQQSRKNRGHNYNKNGKNFLEMNKQVKTKKELQNESIMKQKERMSDVQMRKSQQSFMGYSMMSSTLKRDVPSRANDWHTMSLNHKLLDSAPAKTGVTNKSNTFIIDHDSQANSVEPSNSMSKTFTQTPKEKAWHRTNASEIVLLNSYKTLDVPKGEEGTLLPCKKVGVPEKLNLNQSKTLYNSNYNKEEEIRDQYKSHREVKSVVHNLNNPQVQSQRAKTFSSNVF
eukprot:403354281